VPILLARIDDRLIHGQVAHGWGRALNPTLLAIVSDRLSQSPGEAELYLLAAPEGTEGAAVSVDEALGGAFRSRADAARTVLLFPGTTEPVQLVERGFPLEEVNVGGLHFAPGKREVLPYVYLDEDDRERLRRLLARGVRVLAQDLPSNPAHPMGPLLGGGH
jgi:mannose/fructose/N-acetylgalactosamine-specific phosphotransferase system component IIB